jgi:hypothetical protein
MGTWYHRVQTEWRYPISGVHPIMMEKSALAVEGGDACPPPFSLSPSRKKRQCTLQLRGQVHSLYFICTLYATLCLVHFYYRLKGQKRDFFIMHSSTRARVHVILTTWWDYQQKAAF